MVSKIPDHWYSLQIEIPDDCNAFKLDWSDALAKNVKWALSVFKLLSKYSSYFEKDANSHQWERFPCANKDKMLLCVSRHEICKPTLLKCNVLFSSFLWSGNVTISFWKKNVRAECEANFRFLVSKHCCWPCRILIVWLTRSVKPRYAITWFIYLFVYESRVPVTWFSVYGELVVLVVSLGSSNFFQVIVSRVSSPAQANRHTQLVL